MEKLTTELAAAALELLHTQFAAAEEVNVRFASFMESLIAASTLPY